MEPASIRYKNPGAMWGRTGKRPSEDREVATNNPLAIKWGSSQTFYLSDGLGQGNNIAVFPTYVKGICAQMDLWRTSPHYKNKRLADAIATWSGGNSVESYIKFVTSRVPGLTRDTVMDDNFWRGPMAIPFLKAQAWHEAGKQYPAPDGDWVEARNRVLGGVVPAPAVKPPPVGGTAAKATTTASTAIGTAVVVDKVAAKPTGGIDWSLAIPILVVGFSIAAVVWFVWPSRKAATP